MSSNGGQFRVSFDEERMADALVRELPGVDICVEAEGEGWIVSIAGKKTDQLVVRVLGAVREVVAGRAGASALVRLDEHEYVMRGEDHASHTNGRPARQGVR